MNRPTEVAPKGFLHGWSSATHNDRYGSVVYRREDGTTVHLSEVSEGATPASKWEDLEYMGLVLHYRNSGFVHSCMKPLWR